MSTERKPVALAVGGFLALVGVAMTVVVAIGLVRGGNIPMLLAVWPITGGLPLWGGVRQIKRGLGRE